MYYQLHMKRFLVASLQDFASTLPLKGCKQVCKAW